NECIVVLAHADDGAVVDDRRTDVCAIGALANLEPRPGINSGGAGISVCPENFKQAGTTLNEISGSANYAVKSHVPGAVEDDQAIIGDSGDSIELAAGATGAQKDCPGIDRRRARIVIVARHNERPSAVFGQGT